MGWKTVPCQCEICCKQFFAEYAQTKWGRTPCCSKKCAMEKMHRLTRDAKFEKEMAKVLKSIAK